MTSAARRELAVAVVVLAVVLGATYAMTRVFLDPAWVRPTVAAAALSVVTAAGARRVSEVGAPGSNANIWSPNKHMLDFPEKPAQRCSRPPRPQVQEQLQGQLAAAAAREEALRNEVAAWEEDSTKPTQGGFYSLLVNRTNTTNLLN